MKKKILGFLTISLCTVLNGSAQETFKVMFYNLLNYPLETAVPNREADLELILSDFQPDLFLVCELNNNAGATNVLDITRNSINSNFEMATYASNTSDDTSGDQNNLQNLLYYDRTKFILEDEIIVPTALRDFNIYKLLLNTIDQETDPIEIYIVVCHLKASSGPENAQRRFEMIMELDTYLNMLPPDSNVLLGGDLNLYTASESAFQELLDSSNVITFADPADRIGSWNNNPNFVDVFTQSTRTATGFGGSRGGFDDRFDFILTSKNMLSTSQIRFVQDSYQVYGNNGLSACYNNAINSSACGLANSPFSFTIRNALHNFSDHLPVTVLLETDTSLLHIETVEVRDAFYLEKTIIRDHIILHIDSFEVKNKALIIYNSLGQIVKTLRTNSENKQGFDVSGLSNGLYYISTNTVNVAPLKFIVSN
jgi:endonuclease/exonuclease/phosphatase family metal-dependent hydrolase